jgi:hypothetical protein
MPKASFYKKGEAIIEKYALGRIYTGYSKNNSCVQATLQKINPVQIDTLKDKFSYNTAKIKKADVLEFCP